MLDPTDPVLAEPPYHEILTERLKLRTLRVEDAGRLMPLLGSKEVMQWTVHHPKHSNTILPLRLSPKQALNKPSRLNPQSQTCPKPNAGSETAL